jgi:tetratricopeptide (TPR) repeat protein
MFRNRLRGAVILLSAGLGVYLLVSGFIWGLAFLVAAALLAWGYYRYGTVWLALQALSAGDGERAARLLKSVRRPTRLGSQSRAYYEYMRGVLAAGEERFDRAESHLRSALDHRLRTENDRSLVECTLAEVLALRGQKEEARVVLDRARARDHKPTLDELIERIEQRLREPDRRGDGSQGT